jgi:hypothetical protein
LRTALARDLKGEISPVLYAAAIPLAFVREWIAAAIYVMVALTCSEWARLIAQLRPAHQRRPCRRPCRIDCLHARSAGLEGERETRCQRRLILKILDLFAPLPPLDHRAVWWL